MARKKRKKGKNRRGHFCWCCQSFRPNEKFSGKGHNRHLCRDCARLGPEELEYRQALRDMERCVDFNGRVFRKRRGQFNTFLHHPNPRIRAEAEGIVARRQREVEQWRQREEEYERRSIVEELLWELEYELAAINHEFAEAAELDKSFSHFELACINREFAEAAEIDLDLAAVDLTLDGKELPCGT